MVGAVCLELGLGLQFGLVLGLQSGLGLELEQQKICCYDLSKNSVLDIFTCFKKSTVCIDLPAHRKCF